MSQFGQSSDFANNPRAGSAADWSWGGPGEPAYVDPQTQHEEDLTTIVTLVRVRVNGLPPIEDEGILRKAISQCTGPNRQMGERVWRNSMPDSRGFIDANRLLKDAVVDDCKGFCEDPVNKMVEGIDYERARGRFKATFRAISHFMMTRANDSGVIFRDKVLQMAMKFRQFCKDLCDFDETAWKEGRAQSKEASQKLNQAKSNRLQSEYQKITDKTKKECNQQAQIMAADFTKDGLKKLLQLPADTTTHTTFVKKYTNNVDPGNITANYDLPVNAALGMAKILAEMSIKRGATHKEAKEAAYGAYKPLLEHPGWSKNAHDHVHPIAKRLCIGLGGENPPRRSNRIAPSSADEPSIVRA